MNQAERILSNCKNRIVMADRAYVGKPPAYAEIKDPKTGLSSYKKVRAGIPFVRVQ